MVHNNFRPIPTRNLAMVHPFSCPEGHQWLADSTSSSHGSPVCPQCGRIGQMIKLSSVILSGDATVTPPVSRADSPATRHSTLSTDSTAGAAAALPKVPGFELLEMLGRGGMGV